MPAPVAAAAVKVGVGVLQTPAGRRVLMAVVAALAVVPLLVVLIAAGVTQSLQTAATTGSGVVAACEDDAGEDGVIDCTTGGTGGGGDYDGTGAGPWGGFENGRIPADALCSLSWAPAHRLRCDAAVAFEELNTAYVATFGTNIAVTDSYRDFAGQVAAKASWCARGRCYMAATPGTSNHGWALAVDLGSGINSWGSPQRAWFVANAPSFGWISPSWAVPEAMGGKNEPWHWEWAGGSTSEEAQA